jgi:hypothetical protein
MPAKKKALGMEMKSEMALLQQCVEQSQSG